MPEHPNAARFRAGFEAVWERGDMEPFLELLHPDIVWINDIGAGPWREVHGIDGVLSMQADWMTLFDGGFRQELIDVCASDRNVVEILREVGTARGQVFDNIALYHFTLDEDRRIVQLRTYDQHRDAIERFWAAIGPVVPAPAQRA